MASIDIDVEQTSNPLWLYAYGAYGDFRAPWFSATRLSLLNRGVVYALAHIRGGGARYFPTAAAPIEVTNPLTQLTSQHRQARAQS